MSDSKNWLNEHFRDQYVKRSKREGYPSRAAYKLLEIQEKDQVLAPGMLVLDLGAAPGGWSMVAVEILGAKGHVIAVDLLPMPSIAGVDFIQGDFNDESVWQQILQKVNEYSPKKQVDMIISDMAPNLSGQVSVDQPKMLHLIELVLECAKQLLKPNGTLVIKVFQGAGVDALFKQLRLMFKTVRIRKPDSSRPRSREFYVVATKFCG